MAGRGFSRAGASDAQLHVYAQILPGGFLHYGYFDDPSVEPEALSLRDVERAQSRYAEIIVEQVSDRSTPVFDVGCGMGGLLKLLLEEGLSPVALTPDSVQVEYVKQKYPNVPVVESKFEQVPDGMYRNFFGTVITSESLQYMRLEESLAVLGRILRPGGRWIVTDYFRLSEGGERKSGHSWNEFLGKLHDGGWEIVYQRDITTNVLPTLAYFEMWGRRVGMPLFRFSVEKFQRKHPAFYFLLGEAVADLDAYIRDHLKLVDPALFAQEKKYMLLVIERGT